MNRSIRQSKKNTRGMAILLLRFAVLAGSPGLPIINGYTGKFLKMNWKTRELRRKSKKSMQNPQIRDIEESGMIWNVTMT